MSDNFYNSETGIDFGNSITLSTNWAGAFTGAVNIRYYKLGQIVIIDWPGTAQVAGSPGSVTLTDNLPAGFRPPFDYTGPLLRVNNNAVVSIGTIQIAAATGQIFWYGGLNFDNFTGPGGSNIFAGSISFLAA